MSIPSSRSILDSVQHSFELLVCDPAPLAVDCSSLPGLRDLPGLVEVAAWSGLPQRPVPLDELRRLLVANGTPRPVRDAVWRLLVRRAREDGPAWVIGAVGVAMPGLRRQAGLLTRAGYGRPGDLEADLVDGFYRRLATIDVRGPRVCGRLIDAAVRAVKSAAAVAVEPETVRSDGFVSAPPPQPWSHPDWVLCRAVAVAVIDVDEHVLVGRTYLEGVPLATVARQLGVSVQLAAQWRRKAVRRLVSAVRDGELDPAAGTGPRLR